MHLTNKNTCAPTPPMGWNSYDYYDTTVDEAAVKANADYMAKHLKAGKNNRIPAGSKVLGY